MNLEIYEHITREKIGFIRTFTFVQYTEMFNGIGEFRLIVPYEEASLKLLQPYNYILFEKDVMGIIKFRYKETRIEKTEVDIKGLLINEIMGYRVFDKTYNFLTMDTVDVTRKMVRILFQKNENEKRNIPYIEVDQTPIETVKIVTQRTGNTCASTIQDLLETVECGWKLIPKLIPFDELQSNYPTNVASFIYTVLKPKDRSVGNDEGNDPVVFGVKMNNVENLIYTDDSREYKSMAYVAGEGYGEERVNVEVGNLEKEGIERIEAYIDARDLQIEFDNPEEFDDDGNLIWPEDRPPTEEEMQAYLDTLKQRGREGMVDMIRFEYFEGMILDGGVKFELGKDFNNGDYVTVIDEHLGLVVRLQIVAITRSLTGFGEKLDLHFGKDRITTRELLEKKGVI